MFLIKIINRNQEREKHNKAIQNQIVTINISIFEREEMKKLYLTVKKLILLFLLNLSLAIFTDNINQQFL